MAVERQDGAMAATSVTVDIEAPAPVAGRVRADGQPDRPFTGWPALVASLQATIDALDAEPRTGIGKPDRG
jgi:hypothetical protein